MKSPKSIAKLMQNQICNLVALDAKTLSINTPTHGKLNYFSDLITKKVSK